MYTQPEWAAAFAKDPQGKDRTLVPVRIAPCELPGLLGPIIYVDLVGKNEQAALTALLDGVKTGRAKPQRSPAFPGQQTPTQTSPRPKPEFPGVSTEKPWNVPHARNPFFTGREGVLKKLHEALTSGNAAALSQPQAISGLGGIGKTQTAVEYAYRYRETYSAVLWVRADSQESLISSFVALAELLALPGKDEQDQQAVVAVVKRWLQTASNWLLIFDNADNLASVHPFLPTEHKGHILLTTRAQATGTLAQRIEIDEMSPEEGGRFLLRRAGIHSLTAADRQLAEQISRTLGGLPLALDQAGAFIEETPSSLSEYLGLYKQEGVRLLAERGELAGDHASVTVTFSLAFGQVAARDPAAADLLRLCAFLAPEAIPEEIFTEGAEELGEVFGPKAKSAFELAKVIREAGRFSLIERDAERKTLTIHRLVQTVLQDEMDGDIQRLWAERAVGAVNEAFPDVEVNTWPRCERFLPHAQVCAELITRWNLAFPEAAGLLNQAGAYLHDRARYQEAEPLYQRALAIREQVLGPEHPDVATSLNDLALLYDSQGRYRHAEPLYQRALAIYKKVLGPEHTDVATILNNLNQTTEDSYTSSLAVEPLPFGLSVAERSRRPANPRVTHSSTPPLPRLRSERTGGPALKKCGTVPMSCGSI